MNFSWIATLALIGTAMAAGNNLPAGAPCTKDGKMGTCQSGLCIQDVHASQGTCK
ncbi:uncharacterized protein DSM5745_09400 [Aspergillus mulundensis]|uniref:Antifungal protein n=1 Tax=Aspergillus mulundensis TaxID=1810919 RepID=A0A3D8QVF0_9EURO|nr:Uncharacterized protein DSM5745_09400 [Aspergillus mulundensis]RDW65661.1 Uncharacterized protein DSM5745_09400 [Aspergillus mulundensis]